MSDHTRRSRWPVVCALLSAVLLCGCAGPARLAAEMRDPRVSPRREMELRERLIAMTPASDPYLAEVFFPIGLYDVPESALTEVAAGGFNLVVNSDTTPGYLARAGAAGLRVIPYIRLHAMAEDAAQFRGRRAPWAWYLVDEPDLNRVEPAEYHALARKLRKLDPDRPIFLTVLLPQNYPFYAVEADIVAPNLYPIRQIPPERNNLMEVAYAVDAARETRPRAVWVVLQAFCGEPIWPRPPTPEELRSMAWLALNHGATGVIYFSYRCGDGQVIVDSPLYPAVVRLNGEISALRGALMTPPLDCEIAEDVDCSLRAFAGMHLLIAVNPDPAARAARLRLPESLRNAPVQELFRKQAGAAMTDGTLELDFSPFQARVFWIGP